MGVTNTQKESDDSQRKQQQQWHEGLHLLAGGPHTTIFELWKIPPPDAEDHNATMDLPSS
jgi:hypothetical protein